MTTTVPDKTVAPATPDRAKTGALILAAVVHHGMPFPNAIRMYETNPIPSLSLDFDSPAEYRAWADYLGIPTDWHRRDAVPHGKLPLLMFNATAFDWNGWRHVSISATEDLPEPARCASTYYGGPCPGEDIQSDGHCPQHTSLPVKQIVRTTCPGCGSTSTTHGDWCAQADVEVATAREEHAVQVRREMVEALQHATFSTLPTYDEAAIDSALADGVIVAVSVTGAGHQVYALAERVEAERTAKPACVDPIVAIAEGRQIDLTTVGGYFRETWAKLPALRRAELVEACQAAGWCGDWDAAYADVMGGVRPEAADDARLIVDELDDVPAVSVAQLAEAAKVDPDAEIAYEVARRHDGAQYGDVLTDDPELADVGRGDAEVNRALRTGGAL